MVVACEVDGGLEGHGLQAQADGVELVEGLTKRSPWHYGPAAHGKNGTLSSQHIRWQLPNSLNGRLKQRKRRVKFNTQTCKTSSTHAATAKNKLKQTLQNSQVPLLTCFNIWLSKKTHLSPNDRLQNSAASALVILKLSPWNKPLGKMAFSSASMWLKIRDSLVRFRLGENKERHKRESGRDVITTCGKTVFTKINNKHTFRCLSTTKWDKLRQQSSNFTGAPVLLNAFQSPQTAAYFRAKRCKTWLKSFYLSEKGESKSQKPHFLTV